MKIFYSFFVNNFNLSKYIFVKVCYTKYMGKGDESMQLSDAIREKINRTLKEKNINIWYICKRTGIPCSTITTFMNGKTKLPQIDTLLHICESFDMSLSEFFADEIFIDVEQD